MSRAAPADPVSSRTVRACAAVFLAAAGVHVVVWLQYLADPFSLTYVSDALSYDWWAARIAANGLAAEPVFHQSPLFPVLLAAIYSLAPEVARAAWSTGLQILLSCVAIAALVPLGRIWFGMKTASPAKNGIQLVGIVGLRLQDSP